MVPLKTVNPFDSSKSVENWVARLCGHWVARLWNVSEERGKESPVVGASSVIDFASSMLDRVKVKSFDSGHNSHCALAEREGHSECHSSQDRSFFSFRQRCLHQFFVASSKHTFFSKGWVGPANATTLSQLISSWLDQLTAIQDRQSGRS